MRLLKLLPLALVVFASSFVTLVLELVASRVLAPFVGVSLQTWTVVLSVVLLGISVGSEVGGRLAERALTGKKLALAVLVAAGCALLPWLLQRVGPIAALDAIPVLPRAVLLSLVAFLPACIALAAVGPMTLKLWLVDVREAGRSAGAISALGTIGSLVGNFSCGFLLMAKWPVSTLLLASAVASVLLAVSLAPLFGLQAPTQEQTSSGAATTDVLPLRLGIAIVVGASVCTLALEVGASRLLAPVYGVSLFSWTGIIGVVLTGMALGNVLGAVLADRFTRREVLGATLLVASAACLLVPAVHRVLVNRDAFAGWGLQARIVVHTFCVFFAPVFALGAVSPQVIRLSVTKLEGAGSIAGRLYAWSTAGALVGSLLTGLVLIRAVGVAVVVVLGAVIVGVLGVVVARVWQRPARLGGAFAVVALGAVLAFGGVYRSACTKETDYFCIVIENGTLDGRFLRTMKLDFLTHTLVDLKDPAFLGYPHNTIHAEFARVAAQRAEPKVLVIGGGGYVLPRWLETFLPQVRVDVVEIDPDVTKVALAEFGVKADTRITSFNMDGRYFVRELAQAGAYDVVVQDAVNDLSVPSHLMTKEYDESVRRVLKPGGVFLLSAIDEVPRGSLVRSALRTAQGVFRHTRVLYDAAEKSTGEHVWVIAASDEPIDVERLQAVAREAGATPRTTAMPMVEQEAFLQSGNAVVLTDDFAPVDSMLADVFLLRESSGH